MQPMLRSGMHRGAVLFPCGGFRGQVRPDVVLPETKPRKDVTRHVESMRRSGCNLRVPMRSFKPQGGHLGIVAGVNDEMRDARIVRFLA